jgi:hypothetical protein
MSTITTVVTDSEEAYSYLVLYCKSTVNAAEADMSEYFQIVYVL